MGATSRCIVIVYFVLCWTTISHGGNAASADAARELVALLEKKGLGAVAARDPGGPDTFVAALYIPGQLLVVSARHPSADGLAHRLALSQYREVYLDLHGSPTPGGKFFVQDAGADGIQSDRPSGVDVLYEDGVRQTLFNGDPRGQNLTRDEYEAKVADADAAYARLLKLLTSMLQEGHSTQTGNRAPSPGSTRRVAVRDAAAS